MGYSDLLFRRGSLAKVWLVGNNIDKGVSKRDVEKTDIRASVKSIVEPTNPIALRVSGQLLLGVVRIFLKKLKYIQDDAGEALARVKVSCRGAQIVQMEHEETQLAKSSAKGSSITVADHIDEGFNAIADVSFDNLVQLSKDQFANDIDMPIRRDAGEDSMHLDLSQQLRQVDENANTFDPNLSFSMEQPRRAAEEGSLQLMDNGAGLDFDLDMEGDHAPMDMDLDHDVSLGQGSFQATMNNMSINISVVREEKGAKPRLRLTAKATKRQKVNKVDSSISIDIDAFRTKANLAKITTEKRPTARPRTTTAAKDTLQIPSFYDADYLAPSLKQLFLTALSAPVVDHQTTHAPNSIYPTQQSDGFSMDHAPFDVDAHDPFDDPQQDIDLSLGEIPDPANLSRLSERSDGFSEFTRADDKEAEGEHGWSERTKKVFYLLENKAAEGKGPLVMNDLVQGRSRRAAAVMFHEVLVLQSKNVVSASQDEPFAPIHLVLNPTE